MPRAGDAFLTGALPTTNNPLNRISFDPFTSVFDPIKVLQQVIQFFEDYGIEALSQVTGIDFSTLKTVLDRIKDFLGVLDFTAPGYDPTAAVQHFISTVLVPQGLLAQLSGGKLLESQTPQVVIDFINQIRAILPNLTPTGNIWQDAVNVFTSMLGLGNNAQSTANTALSQATVNTAVINSAGVTITENPVNLANFSIAYRAFGGGAIYTTPSGVIDWNPSGSAAREGWARHTTVMSTNHCDVRFVLPRKVAAPAGGQEAYFYARARINAANDSDVWARIGYNSVLIGLSLSSNLTPIGAPLTVTLADGDAYLFRVGLAASGVDQRRFQLFRNGNPALLDVTDSVGNSQMGAGNLGVGFAESAGANVTTQTLPASMSTFTAADRTP